MISIYKHPTTTVIARKWFHPEDTSSSFLVIMAIEEIFFLQAIVTSMQMCCSMFWSSWFDPCDLQNSHCDFLKGHSLKIPVFEVVQGPIFFTLQFLGSPESQGILLWEAPKMLLLLRSIQELGFPRLHPVQLVRNYHFHRGLAFPRNGKASGMWDFQSEALLHHCF